MNGVGARWFGWLYRRVARPIFFLFDSEPIHEWFLALGQILGRMRPIVWIARLCLRVSHPSLSTTVAGISFENPIGLAAGFDYQGELPSMIDALGFGFESIGTVTLGAYAGNPYPRLKRLVNSKSILVNKGFKSPGIAMVFTTLAPEYWRVPIGISIGRTNTNEHSSHADALRDIIKTFRTTIDSGIPFSYFELNISCPNLLKDISFYKPEYLEMILKEITALNLSKPLFIKMPITLSNADTIALLDVIVKYPVAAIIIGNLQHDRSSPVVDQSEIALYADKCGNLSGMPCQSRSDELIALSYIHTKGALAIVGCGGVFDVYDAYRKIRLGASLIQLATATIFEGPQIAAEINAGLVQSLTHDGYATIKEAVGVDTISSL